MGLSKILIFDFLSHECGSNCYVSPKKNKIVNLVFFKRLTDSKIDRVSHSVLLTKYAIELSILNII